MANKKNTDDKGLILGTVKETTQLVIKGLDKSPALLAPLLVIAALGAIITCLLAGSLVIAGQPQLAYQCVRAALGFLVASLICFVIAVYIGKKTPDDAPVETGYFPDAPLLNQASKLVKSGQHSDLLIRRSYCPTDPPASPPEFSPYSVYHLWSDPRGGSITASFDDPDKPDHLIIEFNSTGRCWASNVTLRPCGLHPYARLSEQRYLCLDVQAPSPVENGQGPEVGLTFRIYDERGTIWYWGRSENDLNSKKIDVSNRKWRTIALPLAAEEWRLFASDGNSLYASEKGPEFDQMILALVMVVGGHQGSHEPGPGKGRLLVRNIRFEKEPPGAN